LIPKSSSFLTFIFSIFALNAYALEDNDVRRAVKQVGGVEAFIKTVSETMAKNTPQQLDKDTQLISVLANGSTINLLHVATNMKAKQEILDKNFIPNLIKFQTNKLCTSPVSKVLINEFDATYHYQYIGNTGENLFTFSVKRKNCVK
jgi:hypothetical protein